MKIRKKFTYQGVELQIVDREEDYMGGAKVTVTRVIAPNGGTVPLKMRHKETLKSIAERSIWLLDSFKERGANVAEILTKPLPKIEEETEQ
jgi:hypothetical protein